MIKKEGGFSLIELMVTMVVFVFAIAAASTIFTSLLTQFKQQTKIAETNIEGIVGLEILRQDLDHAGFGLPWNVRGGEWDDIAYTEATAGGTPFNPSLYNDSTRDLDADGNPGETPRAIVGGNNVGLNGSDYLVIKASIVATNGQSQKWATLLQGNQIDESSSSVLPGNNDRVTVIASGTSSADDRALITAGGFFTKYVDSNPDSLLNATFAPEPDDGYFVVYGVAPDNANPLKMPFNRADYYIDRPGGAAMPSRCAPQTGILYKATLDQYSSGAIEFNKLPLLDCVVDMQVIYGLDMNDDGTIGTFSNADGSSTTDTTREAEGASAADVQATLASAERLRERLKEIRIYILAQEGQKDPGFTFTGFNGGCATCIILSDPGLGKDFDLSAITDRLNYRWKVYTLITAPINLWYVTK